MAVGAVLVGILCFAGGVPMLGISVGVIFAIIAVVIFRKQADDERRRRDLPANTRRQKKQVAEAIYGLAREFESTTVEDETGLPSFLATIGGLDVQFSASIHNLIIEAHLPMGKFRLFVHPFEQVRAQGFRNVVDFPVGDHHFDSRFLVQTNEGDQARRLLSDDVRGTVHRLADVVEPDSMSLTFNAGRAKFFVPLPSGERDRTVHFALEVLQAVQRELGIWSDDDVIVEIVPKSISVEVADCLVCGDEVVEDLVKCRHCRTPHHHECWVYIGKCSVYGCGSSRFDAQAKSSGIKFLNQVKKR